MNAARRAARAGRNLLIALLIGAVIIAAIVIAYVAGRNSGTPVAGPTSTSVTTATATASNSPAAADAAPTGCLGGEARNIDMLLTAQRSAPHSAYGAVELATAFFRWAYRYPYPSSAEAREVRQQVIASAASSAFKDIEGSYASAGDITGGQVAGGTPFFLSTTAGLWVIRAGSSSDRVTVDLNAAYVIDGALSPTKTAAISATLVWNSGSWHVLSEQQPDTAALSAGGTQFTAGC
jgi:hypothetical protein